MSTNERQKRLYQKRKKEGWKFMYVPPSMVAIVKKAVKELMNKQGVGK